MAQTNFTRANPLADIYKNPVTGKSPYDIKKNGTSMYAPETFTTDRDMAALNAMRAKTPVQATGSIPLSFGDKVATPNVGSVPAPTTPMNNTDAAKAVYNMTAQTPPPSIATNTDPSIPAGYYQNKAADGSIYYTTADNGMMSNPGGQDTSKTTMDSQIKTMQDAIAARYDDMMNQARQVSGMNQSTIRGNLGRVFGANADTSEASPIITENGRLNANLQSLGTAKNQALSELSMNALYKAQEQANIENQAKQAAQQQAFNNMVTQSQLTGMFNGGLTQDAQQNEFMRAIQEAGLTGQYKGGQTMSAQEQALSKAIQEAGLTGMYNGGLTQGAMQNIAGMTGYFNGQPTLQRENTNLTNQQKQLNDYLDYIASTTNNQNTNATKLTNTGLLNTGKLDLANVNNQADLEQLLKSLLSRETIASGNNASRETVAGMNNSSRESIASQNNASKFSLLEQKLASGTASGADAKIYAQVLKALDSKAKAEAGSKMPDGFGGVTNKYNFNPSEFDTQIANLLSLVEKKN